jgi:D-serine deaminase-like pyridoxal phosphate-dependent protein
VTVQELDTPAVLVDLDALDRNIDRMARYCRERGLQLRPHTKTHKNAGIAQQQIDAGACGITVAKTGEAEVMAAAGIGDIMIAYPIATPSKAERVAELARSCRIRVSLDSEAAAECLSIAASKAGTEIGVLVEIDVGFGRCGVASPGESLALARRIRALQGLRFDGLMFYPGQIRKPSNEQTPMIEEVNRLLRSHYQVFADAGIGISTVSGGSTPTAFRSHEFEGVTEIRPGMYAFLDRNMLSIGVGEPADCAVSVLVTVVSNAVSGRAMVDGGSKTFSSDSALAPLTGFGSVLEAPEAELMGFSEEHGHLDVSGCARSPQVGERLRIIPNHVCATMNLHDRVWGHRGGVVERELTVDARGKLR